MARKTISELTGLFETGDTPGGADFASIFDSNFNLQETGTSVASGSLNVLTNISASSISASSFQGDGSAITGVISSSYAITASHALNSGGGAAFPHTGSTAAIISRSIAPGDTDSTTLKLLGSGSISGSGLFEIQGSTTTLFSVTDDLTGELFAVNDASGLSIISAHTDRTVKLGKPGGFGIVISGSNPLPTDAAARIEISGSTYFTGDVADFSNVTTITCISAGWGPSATTFHSLTWFM